MACGLCPAASPLSAIRYPRYPVFMLITLLDLEREPVSFDVSLPSGAIDYGDEATQIGPLAVQGNAELLREHRGPKEIVADILNSAPIGPVISKFPAPAASSPSAMSSAATSISSSAPSVSMPVPSDRAPRHARD